jgi:hypothetical protein
MFIYADLDFKNAHLGKTVSLQSRNLSVHSLHTELQEILLQHKPPNVTVHILQTAFIERSMEFISFAPTHTLYRQNSYQNWRILTFQFNCVSNKEATYGKILEMAYDACRPVVLPVRSRVVFTYFTETNQNVMPLYNSDSADDPQKLSFVLTQSGPFPVILWSVCIVT